MRGLKAVAAIAVGVASIAVWTIGAHAYATFAKWASSPVPFYVNPANADVSPAAAVAALQVGMNAWSNQSGSSFDYQYAGQVGDTSTALDRRNVAIFRNASNGSVIATTYSWFSSGILVDSDIVFWDGGFRFFTGTSGCGGSNGVYIEDVATHELGHALGMNHSTFTDATMYPSYVLCSQTMRTLAADDMAGAQFLYPLSQPSANTAPIVTIASPSNGASFVEGTSISFGGSASDSQDGGLTSSLNWTSSRDGAIGLGGSFSRALSVGTHTIIAAVTDSGGLQGTRQITVTVTGLQPPASGPSLTTRGYKLKGLQKVELRWSGLTGSSIDVYRDGTKVLTTPNDGIETDTVNRRGSATYVYKVCQSGSAVCSNQSTVSF